MIKKLIISWFHRLFFNIRTVRNACCPLFFTINLSIIFVLTGIFTGIPYADGNCARVLAAEEESEEDGSMDESEDNIVIVIDPGHGGENLGGEYEDYTEKDMTMVVAKSMKEELDKYEGITVYLTRDTDKDMSLEERSEYAKSVGADFLFCLHFNLSEYHTLFGAETWISAFGEEYSRGYAFASIEMDMLEELGLYSRGIKTRLNDSGTDYYGIIRHSTARNIPCVLIEHCHLDQENDQPFYDHNEKLIEFGKLDAEAVAKYYGLKSDILGKDYSDYKNIDVAVPVQAVRPDRTEPDICFIELVEQNKKNGDVTISVSAADYDSGMLYYTYSYDGGQTFSDLQRWPDKTRDTFEFTFKVPSGTVPQVLVNAYNGYDLYTTSNTLNLASVNYEDESDIDDAADNENDAENAGDSQSEADALETASSQVLSTNTDSNPQNSASVSTTTKKKPLTMVYFIKVVLICIIIVLAMIWSILLVVKRQKRKRSRR